MTSLKRSDYVAVMYLRQINGDRCKGGIFKKVAHPYTYLLLNSIPDPDPRKKSNRLLPKGEIPSSVKTPSGCRFHTRCPYAKDLCKNEELELRKIENDHFVKCHFPL